MNKKVELHPEFEEWYNEIKNKWKKMNSHKEYAIYVINRMGFGSGLENSKRMDISLDYPELRSEMQGNKEKYTRAILDDNWTVRKNKLYYVKFPFADEVDKYLNKGKETEEIFISGSDETFFYKTKLTEKEIKAIDERFLAFAELVEGIE